MKKTFLFAAALLALAACDKQNPVSVALGNDPPVKEEDIIDPSKLVFNIDVQNGNATKGVKTVWEDGDDVYVFFEDNTTQYVKMTCDGGSWNYADKDDGTTYEGLALEASGKKLSAVIRLTAPAGITQLFIPGAEYPSPGSDENVLTATHIAPFSFDGIVPGGAAVQSLGTYGFPLTPYGGTIAGVDTGFYFWGILEAAGTYDFEFQLVRRSRSYGFALSSRSKNVKNLTVPASFAAKLTGLTDNGNFVSMGYPDWPLRATGNLDGNRIAGPLDYGRYYRYGCVESFQKEGQDYYHGMENPLPLERDAANHANNTWRICTGPQLKAVSDENNIIESTAIYGNKNGFHFKSRANGISLFFVLADLWHTNQDAPVDLWHDIINGRWLHVQGLYGSSTPGSDERYAHGLSLNPSGYPYEDNYRYVMTCYRYNGLSIRPVKMESSATSGFSDDLGVTDLD